MALGPRLDLRQSQSLVMTPQLQQAIKLLALSNLEIEAVVAEAVESNPLLETGESESDGLLDEHASGPALSDDAGADNGTMREGAGGDSPPAHELMQRGAGEADAPLDIDTGVLDRDRDTGDWAAQSVAGGGEDAPDIAERGRGGPSLAEHLDAQIGAVARDSRIAFVARYLVGLLDEAGYLPLSVAEIAALLDVQPPLVEEALAALQTCDPTGVGARSLRECLLLQAREADRCDPCMLRLLDNLELVATGKFAQLKRLCAVDEADLSDMLAELRGYDPKPGLRFAEGDRTPVVPDILVTRAARAGAGDDPGKGAGDGEAGDWDIALNEETLPRLVVNRGYYLELRAGCPGKDARGWLSEKLADANWLVKALDQRQKTILKVAAEIVTQQDGFFRHGVSELRPLTLRAVASAIDMHESTVSRVTSNKYLHCDRGTFELKYFFTSGIAATGGEGTISAEAVKARIRARVDGEPPDAILSDDKLVELLRAQGFDLARRTVAKYREALGIGSSVQRRRQKKLERL